MCESDITLKNYPLGFEWDSGQYAVAVRKGVVFLVLLLLFGSNSSAAVANELHGTYQIDFVPITTPLGTPSVTEAQVRDWVTNAGAIYERISGGKIKLEFRSLYPTQVSDVFLETPAGIKTKFPAAAVPKSSTAVKSVLIGLMNKNTSYGWAGMAIRSGDEIVFNGINANNQANVSVLVHELGHILGLGHANSIYCPPNTLIVNCEITEYGDYSDIMGSYIKSYVSYEGRFNAISLARLDLISADDVYLSTESDLVELVPLYGGLTGYKLIFLPIYNRMGYSIEYRPATGLESWLSQTRVFDSANRYYNNVPSYGLQVRVLGSQLTETETWLPKTDPVDYMIYYNSSKTRQGLDVGQGITLPDGSSVQFVSGGGDGAVVVQITRPTDTAAPEVGETSVSYEEQPGFPVVSVSYTELTDDRLVAKLELVIDGEVVTSIDNPDSTGSLSYQLTSGKPFSYQLIATDFAGNKRVSESTTATVDCTNQKCYVGASWQVDTPRFGVKLPKAQLQQLVNKKWVAVASAPQIRDGKDFIYNLKYTPKKKGTFTYRIYIPESAKWAAWIGKSFKQRVIG